MMGVPDASVGLPYSKAPRDRLTFVKLLPSARLRMQWTVAESRGTSGFSSDGLLVEKGT